MDADFERFATARLPALRHFALVLTANADDADDLVQTALVRTALRWKRINDQGRAEAYVRAAMVNLHINHRRRLSRREEPSDHLAETPAPEVDLDLNQAIWAELSRLPPRQRAAVVLRYYEQLSYAEIAAALDCSVGNAKSQTSRGLDKLRQAIQKDDLKTRG